MNIQAPTAARQSQLPEFPGVKRKVSEAEWQARVDLAASYRLVAHHGWDDMLSTHISARIADEPDAMLLNPYGLLFSQVTASSLIKVRISDGRQLSQSPLPLNAAGINIHSAVLRTRPEVVSALHLHTIAGVAVSTLKEGLMPLNQRALYFGPHNVAYHDYEGIATDAAEQETLARDLSDKWVLFLRNHGTLTLGRSIAQAFVCTFFLERACQMQIATLSCGRPVTELGPDVIARVPEQARHVRHWGRFEWPALLTLLDQVSPGYDA
jgi:ribulose-5-phosphate 4-epimerase/fuculose-1-phosphate aldolase